MHDWQTTLLALCFLASTAAFFIVWSKYEDQKQKTSEEHNAYRNALEYGNAIAEALKEERNRRWDEISRAVGLENEIAHWKEANTDKQKDIAFYLVELGKQYAECEKMKERLSALQTELEQEKAYFESCRAGNHALQDKLSAILCPANNHVWVDGVCVKCGRVQDD